MSALREPSTLAVLFAGLAACFAGCGGEPDPWPRAAVEGEVLLDGEPLEEGTITFFPIGQTKGPAAGATIRDGVYSLSRREGPVVGLNHIEISSVRKTGRIVESPMAVEGDGQNGNLVEEYVEFVPPQFNRDSKLERTIVADEVNTIDLELESLPP